jgi:hypothetical protein
LAIGNLLITVRPFVDRFKSFVPFVQQLEKNVSSETPLYAYRPDETTLGVVNFYTGRDLIEVGLERLQTMGHRNGTIPLIVRDSKKKDGNYGQILKAGIPHRLLSEQVVGDDRTMRILAVGNETNR